MGIIMSRRTSKDKKIQKNIAKNRIIKLFTAAEYCALSGKLNLANRYVEIARKISMKYQISIPKDLKRCFCKHCYSFMLPNVTSRVRMNKGKIVFYCFKCKKYTRIPLKNH